MQRRLISAGLRLVQQQRSMANLPEFAPLYAAFAGVQQPSPTSLHCLGSVRYYSQALQEALKSELGHEQSNYKKPEGVAQGPPSPFVLDETAGDTHMVLKRTFNQETISVDFSVNDQPEPQPAFNPEEDGQGGDQEDNMIMQKSFVVHVKKGEQELFFEMLWDGQSLLTLHMGLEPTGGHKTDSYYSGPVYDELDEQLRGRVDEFLTERGITPALAQYVTELIEDKEQQEYMAWLKNVHDFVGQ